jgi:glutamine synthetase
MGAALDALERDPLLLDALGPLLSRCYLSVRRSEQAAFESADLAFEVRAHFYRF